MYRALSVTGALLLAAAIGACSGGDQSKSAQPASPAAAPDAKKVDNGTAGSIGGKVLIEGTVPANAQIRMASDPACAEAHKDAVDSQTFVVKDGGLDNVFVYIKDGLGNKYVFDTPTEPLKIEQKGCQYVPHVLGARVSQPIEIVNDDATMHNVHGLPEANQEFNYGQAVQGLKNTVAFSAPEVMVPLKCDVHSWMHAFVGVVNHPFFAVTADGGAFELRGVPPGTYTIEAWHEKAGRQSQTVTIGEKENKQITFTFKAAA
jgi:hypothetical protein